MLLNCIILVMHAIHYSSYRPQLDAKNALNQTPQFEGALELPAHSVKF